MRLFSTEAVSKFHPDKYADQISDAIVTECLRQDPDSRCGIEVMVKDTTVVFSGEITRNAAIDLSEIVHRVASKLDYKVEAIINMIGCQSKEIHRAVSKESSIGAGDQGMMFGYATSETESKLPKEYLSHHLPTKFDSKWLDKIAAAAEGNQLLEKLGAKQTEYGILSTRGGSLYDLVPFGEPKPAEIKTQTLTDEKLEVVEVLGQTALFTNGRVTQKELPEGLYKYNLREGESVGFASIEQSVAVNHAGTIITKEPIIFGAEGLLEFDEESAPNFLGDEMTLEEFRNTDFTQDEDESQQLGGMQL